MNKTDEAVLWELRRQAASGRTCPGNDEIARRIGLRSPSSAANAIARLEIFGDILVRRSPQGRCIIVDGVELVSVRFNARIIVPLRGSKRRAARSMTRAVRPGVVTLTYADSAAAVAPPPPPPRALPQAPRTLTARIFGDPPPGRSALDRRGAP